jgi:hypothetical protein
MPGVENQEVLLESPAVIALLLDEWLGPKRRRPAKPIVSSAAAPPTKQRVAPVQLRETRTHPRSRHCSCGACARCIDNARWNRIFNEKFADPSYYGGVSVRHNSSLARV